MAFQVHQTWSILALRSSQSAAWFLEEAAFSSRITLQFEIQCFWSLKANRLVAHLAHYGSNILLKYTSLNGKAKRIRQEINPNPNHYRSVKTIITPGNQPVMVIKPYYWPINGWILILVCSGNQTWQLKIHPFIDDPPIKACSYRTILGDFPSPAAESEPAILPWQCHGRWDMGRASEDFFLLAQVVFFF